MTAAERVRRAAAKLEQALTERDAAVRAMREEGASLREVAAAAGITHSGVARILRRHDHDA